MSCTTCCNGYFVSVDASEGQFEFQGFNFFCYQASGDCVWVDNSTYSGYTCTLQFSGSYGWYIVITNGTCYAYFNSSNYDPCPPTGTYSEGYVMNCYDSSSRAEFYNAPVVVTNGACPGVTFAPESFFLMFE